MGKFQDKCFPILQVKPTNLKKGMTENTLRNKIMAGTVIQYSNINFLGTKITSFIPTKTKKSQFELFYGGIWTSSWKCNLVVAIEMALKITS